MLALEQLAKSDLLAPEWGASDRSNPPWLRACKYSLCCHAVPGWVSVTFMYCVEMA